MFVREKTINGYTYLYLVESVREDGRTKQRIIKNLGRKEAVLAAGDLERLAASIGRFAERAVVLQALKSGTCAEYQARRIGGPLLFGRLWERLGIGEVIANQLAGRGFEFPVERAVFTATLHRLFVSGSDRDCASWMQDYDIPGADDLSLHHFYRAMAWLGEELLTDEQKDATPFSPRTVKDVIEEALFARRRDLFTDLSIVFMDTTSLSFHGEGGETLGARGYSKDHRPDLNQMILAVIVDANGRPVCTEMMPGNTADVSILIPVAERLRARFGITRACVVADRGMISQATIATLEEHGLEYVLGVRERTDARMQRVLDDSQPFTPLLVERSRGETQLFAKEVVVDGIRYIVCRNEVQAEKDREDRKAVIAGLDAQLKKGDKALVGNSAYRRYLKTTKADAFEIDAGKIAEEARYDGIFVLRTNARISPLQAMLRYRDLLTVETLFRVAKATLSTRPIFHSSDAAIRGHVFCSFLALVLHKELFDRCTEAGLKPEWAELLRDLDRLQVGVIEKDGRSIQIRTPVTGQVGSVFRAAGVALPPNIGETEAA